MAAQFIWCFKIDSYIYFFCRSGKFNKESRNKVVSRLAQLLLQTKKLLSSAIFVCGTKQHLIKFIFFAIEQKKDRNHSNFMSKPVYTWQHYQNPIQQRETMVGEHQCPLTTVDMMDINTGYAPR